MSIHTIHICDKYGDVVSLDRDGNFLPKQNTDESVVCLSRKDVSDDLKQYVEDKNGFV